MRTLNKTKRLRRKKNKSRKTKTGGNLKTRKFKHIITTAFEIIAAENGWTDHKIAAKSYLNYLSQLTPITEGTFSGGGFEFKKYLELFIGRFDTPCEKIISNVAFMLYCITVAAMWSAWKRHGNLNDTLEDDAVVHALDNPIQYALYYNFRFIYDYQEQIFGTARAYLQKIIENISSKEVADMTAGHAILLFRIGFYNPQLYERMIVRPIACILKPVIHSCAEMC